MSKVSVFRFNIGLDISNDVVNSIIKNYLEENEFNYDYNEQCYIVGKVSEKEANEGMALEIVDALYDVSIGINHIYVNPNIHPCLVYEIYENQLIIKAYILNNFSGSKSYIHLSFNTNVAGREYYNSLKENLFNNLEQNNVNLVSTQIEKIKDCSSIKLLKKIIIIIVPLIIFFALMALISYLSTN